MKKAIITGITGQDGHYLKELLLSKKYQVHGIARRDSSPSQIKILKEESNYNPNFLLHYANLNDANAWIDLLEFIKPDEIYNLAAQTHVADSLHLAELTCNLTGLGPLRILEAIRHLKLTSKVKFFQASSSEMFGNVIESPQSENTVFNPRSPYGCAKIMAHYLTINYRELYNMYACSGILFNHESPKRNEKFVTRKITRAAARIKLGLQDTLHLGNISSRRDWGYAGDYVEAMWLMLQQNAPADFIIASGQTHSIQEFLEEAFQLLGLNWKDYVQYDIHEERVNEKSLLCGNTSAIKAKLGWTPSVSFEELVKLMVEADYALALKEKELQFSCKE